MTKQYGHVYVSDGLNFIDIICSFNDAERFMRCCTALHLALDNQQNDNTKTRQPHDRKRQQYENAEEEMQGSENIVWQTAKETESSPCKCTKFELSSDTQQQREGGTKVRHHSALSFFSSRNKISKRLSKFQKNVKAWFTNGDCPPHYR